MGQYMPPPTDAHVAAFFGAPARLIEPNNVQALMLFSTDGDTAEMMQLASQIPGVSNLVKFDGANGPFPEGSGGSICPPLIYGLDGRKVNCFVCDYQPNPGVTPIKLTRCVGELLAMRGWGYPWYNLGSQPPYTKLTVVTLPDDIQIVWGH